MSVLFSALLVTHIVLAVGLFLPSVALPFALRPAARRAPGEDAGPLLRTLLYLQGTGTLPIGAGLAATGTALLALLGVELLAQPWLLVALAVYGVTLGLAYFVQRPALRRVVGLPDDEHWATRARRLRHVSYLIAAAVGLIGLLMMSKPNLW